MTNVQNLMLGGVFGLSQSNTPILSKFVVHFLVKDFPIVTECDTWKDFSKVIFEHLQIIKKNDKNH